jgi:CheY-like chemotaxis protein
MTDKLGEKKKLLLIEDNIETQLIFKVYLRDKYSVEIAENAEKGLERLKKEPYDVLLLDIHLPGELTGEDVIQEIRTTPKLEKIPIIVITAYALKGDREKFLKLGADDYLPKPVEKSTLLGVVEKYI